MKPEVLGCIENRRLCSPGCKNTTNTNSRSRQDRLKYFPSPSSWFFWCHFPLAVKFCFHTLCDSQKTFQLFLALSTKLFAQKSPFNPGPKAILLLVKSQPSTTRINLAIEGLALKVQLKTDQFYACILFSSLIHFVFTVLRCATTFYSIFGQHWFFYLNFCSFINLHVAFCMRLNRSIR